MNFNITFVKKKKKNAEFKQRFFTTIFKNTFVNKLGFYSTKSDNSPTYTILCMVTLY